MRRVVRKEEVAMKEPKYHLSVRDCRAIKTAEIDLAEITVFAGINASGKSTLARIFRDLVEFSAEYERLLSARMWIAHMDKWRYALCNLTQSQSENIKALSKINIPEGLSKGKYTFTECVNMLGSAIREVLSASNEDRTKSLAVSRLQRVLDLQSNVDVLDVFQEETKDVLAKFDERRKQRSYEAYHDLMKGNPLLDGRITLNEGSRTVYSNDNAHDTLDEISFIKRAIYIESPFKSIPQSVTTTELDMRDSFFRIKEDVPSLNIEHMPELRNVISGDVDFVKDFDDEGPTATAMKALFGRDGRWVYHRSDGSSFDLDECATGIKSLSILNILYSKGWLDAETLLIIDEPEAHLHPQWVVEYARLLLLLSKRLRVRIVITSHSPDMINAIHTIGTASGMGEDIEFYLAEKDAKDAFKFNYRSLGNAVGDIFKAYNISFDKIDRYANMGLSK